MLLNMSLLSFKKLTWPVKIDYDGIFYDPVSQNDGQRKSLAQPLSYKYLYFICFWRYFNITEKYILRNLKCFWGLSDLSHSPPVDYLCCSCLGSGPGWVIGRIGESSRWAASLLGAVDYLWAGHPPPLVVGLAIGRFGRFPEPPAVIIYLRPHPPLPPSTIAITIMFSWKLFSGSFVPPQFKNPICAPGVA